MTSTTKGGDTFNSLANDSTSFWEKYARGRPSVPSSFWRRLITYHTQHGNAQFSHIHDLGSGPGIHAASLAKHFSHVTLTDPSDASIEAARTHLSQLPDSDRYTYQVGRAEDPIKPEDVSKYDMVFLGNALHWMDIPTSLANVANTLRNGGTLIAALFGVPDVADPIAYKALQDWLRYGVDMVVERDTSGTPTLGHAMYAQDSDYDSIHLDPMVWENVTRIKLNRPKSGSRGYITEKIIQKYGVDASAVTDEETVLSEDDSDWYVTTDLSGLRELVGSFPIPMTPEGDKKLWDCLNEVYASKPVEIHWGVGIVLATKRSRTGA